MVAKIPNFPANAQTPPMFVTLGALPGLAFLVHTPPPTRHQVHYTVTGLSLHSPTVAFLKPHSQDQGGFTSTP